MNEINNNNIYQYHCPCCRNRQQNKTTAYSPVEDYQGSSSNYWGRNIEKDNAVCIKCAVEDKKMFMDKFANGMFICKLTLFCKERRSWLLANKGQVL